MTPGSEVESKPASGDAPLAPEMPPPATQSESAQGGVAPPDERRSGDRPDISAEAWLGPAGSLGPHRRDSTLPKSNFSQEVSRAFTSSLRHGNGPKIKVALPSFPMS